MSDVPPILLIAVWLFIILVILRNYLSPKRGIGVVALYLFLLAMTHLLPATLYLFPSYEPLNSTEIIFSGFLMSTIGVVGFCVGAVLWGPLLWTFHYRRTDQKPNLRLKIIQQIPTIRRIAAIYIVVGLFAYFVLVPLLGQLPTINAFVDGLRILFPLGLIILYHQSRIVRYRSGIAFVFSMLIIWPMITVIKDGFLGFGVYFMLFVLTFIISTQSRHTRLLFYSAIFTFIALTVYVNYFAARDEIRQVVWQGNDNNLASDAQTVIRLFTDFEFFSPLNSTHLYYIDLRFNYNNYAGSVKHFMQDNRISYANGQTIIDGFLMLVPRILWPDKSLVAGGDMLLVRYAGIDLWGATSAAPGHIGEAYLNFGFPGIFGVMFAVGTILALIERGAIRCLENGNYAALSVWLAPAIGILNPEVVFLENIASSISAWLVVLVFVWFLTRRAIYLQKTSVGRIVSLQTLKTKPQ